MSSKFFQAWNNVERGCFEYLARALGTIEDVQGFTVDTLPRVMPADVEDYFIWTFKIDGGSEIVQRNSRSQVVNGAWKMDAQFTAFCVSDYTAKRVAGIIIDALPCDHRDGIEGLARLYQVSNPTRQHVLRNVESDERAGDQQRFVEITINMECSFSNI
jgi:hypothetical protein